MNEEQPVVDNEDESRNLIEYLDSLKDIAKKSAPTDKLKKLEKYYSASYDDSDKKNNIQNQCNVIKPIIETKTTLILDAQIKTSVVPQLLSFIDSESLDNYEGIADILSAGLSSVFKVNKSETLLQKIVRRGEKTGIGILETLWDTELSNGLGNVSLSEIPPENFFPDPSGTSIQDCNYIFIEISYSIFSLKKKYPDLSDKIDKLASDQSKSNDSNAFQKITNSVLNYISGSTSGQVFTGSNADGIKNASKNIKLTKCYLKDDSTSKSSEGDNKDIQEAKEQLSYPFGRVILYGGKDTVFDDKPLDSPFGYPIDIFNPIDNNSLWGLGDIEDLCEIQDQLNRAIARKRTLVAQFVSLIMYEIGGTIDSNNFVNQFTLGLEVGTFAQGSQPRVLTNNTLSEIEQLSNTIDGLKKDAMRIARINESMVTGERPTGVTSGQMLQDLNESPMASIRGIQRNYKEFMISVSQKIVTLIQLYYNVPRLIKLGTGDKYAQIPARVQSEPNNPQADQSQQISIFEKGATDAAKTINGDLSLGQYDVEIVAGSEIPRTREYNASLMAQYFDKGILGKQTDPDVVGMYLRSQDSPYEREVVQRLRDEQKEQASQPINVAALVDKLAANFKDMPDYAKTYILQQLGINPPPPPIQQPPIGPIQNDQGLQPQIGVQ